MRLTIDDDMWRKTLVQVPYRPEVSTAEDLDRVARPAFGFWGFDFRIADGIRDASSRRPGGAHRMGDLTGYWPELCLMQLPGTVMPTASV
ncbi:hypothetical protein QBC35DRAFT_503966 [Podospora australis]|uniref:Uncharacterized protein n=1 Tax=Podospora australis TaxID=1536484 RepID=A0AAN6WNW3_9PEZI|nr:hypothetical protein QBC35DRAFT_503966 [Podospora australis]